MESKIDEALTLFQNGQLNKAKDICLEILKAQPNHFDTLHLLGLIAFQTKNYLKSVEIFDRAIQAKPDDAEIYNFHAIVLIHLKKLEEAVGSWNCAIKINPNYAEAYYNRGNALVELKKTDQIKDYGVYMRVSYLLGQRVTQLNHSQHSGGEKRVATIMYLLALQKLNPSCPLRIVDEINQNLTLVEKIKKFYLLEENFSIENGLLTPTMKVKRNKVTQKYKNILENFYKK